MEPLLSIVMIWPTKSLGMKFAKGNISVLINRTTYSRERSVLDHNFMLNTECLDRRIYLYVNGFILLKFLGRYVVWRCAMEKNQNTHELFKPSHQHGTSISFTYFYLLVKRKSSKALASSGHIVSNFPEEACWRATGSPIDSTFSREATASFQVLSEGQAYFKPNGILRV